MRAMKLFYLLFSFLFASALLAQEKKLQRNNLGHVEVAEVVRLDSFSSAQLYCNAQRFLASFFENARETAQLKDERAKSVATKASFAVTVLNSYGEEIKAKTYFTLMIQARENMYRYSLDDFYFAVSEHSGITSYASFNDRKGIGMSKNEWEQVEAQTEDFINSFVQDLKEHMLQTDFICRETFQSKKAKKDMRN